MQHPIRSSALLLAMLAFSICGSAQVDPLPPNGQRANGQPPIQDVQSPASTIEEQLGQYSNNGRLSVYDPAFHSSLMLSNQQVLRLQELDSRYLSEYDRISRTATPDYNTLNEQRFGELRQVLNPEQYDRWQQMDRARLQDLPLNSPQAPPSGLPDAPVPPRP